MISLLAKQEFAVPRVVARVNNSKNQWLFNESWGVDISVSTPQLITAIVEEAVSVGSLVRLLQFEGGATHLVEVTLDPGEVVIAEAGVMMYMTPSDTPARFPLVPRIAGAALVVSAVIIVYLGVLPARVLDWAVASISSIF